MSITGRVKIIPVASVDFPAYSPCKGSAAKPIARIENELCKRGPVPGAIAVRQTARGRYEVVTGGTQLQALIRNGKRCADARVFQGCGDFDARRLSLQEFVTWGPVRTGRQRRIQDLYSEVMAIKPALKITWVGGGK